MRKKLIVMDKRNARSKRGFIDLQDWESAKRFERVGGKMV